MTAVIAALARAVVERLGQLGPGKREASAELRVHSMARAVAVRMVEVQQWAARRAVPIRLEQAALRLTGQLEAPE